MSRQLTRDEFGIFAGICQLRSLRLMNVYIRSVKVRLAQVQEAGNKFYARVFAPDYHAGVVALAYNLRLCLLIGSKHRVGIDTAVTGSFGIFCFNNS